MALVRKLSVRGMPRQQRLVMGNGRRGPHAGQRLREVVKEDVPDAVPSHG